MTTRPSTYLGWVPSNNPSYVAQPTAGQQNTGWVYGEMPPFTYMNWLFYTTDQWIQYLDSITSNGFVFQTVNETNTTVTAGTTLFYANLTIDTGKTWSVPTGAALWVMGPLKVNGTLNVAGTCRVI